MISRRKKKKKRTNNSWLDQKTRITKRSNCFFYNQFNRNAILPYVLISNSGNCFYLKQDHYRGRSPARERERDRKRDSYRYRYNLLTSSWFLLISFTFFFFFWSIRWKTRAFWSFFERKLTESDSIPFQIPNSDLYSLIPN